MIKVGNINKLIVSRKTDLGYMLKDNDEEVFMHFNDNANKNIKVGDTVEAFVYFDKQQRTCATTKTPNLKEFECKILEINEVNSKIGVFVDNNTSKDLLLSINDLPLKFESWPKVGDKLPLTLKVKPHTLVAKIATKDNLLENKTDSKYAIGETIKAHIFRIVSEGINAVSDDFKIIFIHKTMIRKQYRLGEEVDVKIIHIKNDNEYNGSLIEQKESQIGEDEKIILEYLNSHHGVMPLDSKSQSEEVERVISMSRKAFKRALGGLYKEEKVYFENDKTYLKK